MGGTVRTFPYFTRNNVTSVGGTCGTATGDLAPVTVLVNGSSAGTVNCSAGAWTLTTSWTTDGTRIVSATQADVAGNTGTAPARSVIVDKTRPTVLSHHAGGGLAGGERRTVGVDGDVLRAGVRRGGIELQPRSAAASPAPRRSPGCRPWVGPRAATWTVSVGVAGVTGTNAGSIGLNLTNRGSVADPAGNTLLTTALTGQAYTYDTTTPTVSGVSSPLANGRYGIGQVIPVTVTFSEPVTVSGTPQLALATGSPATTAAPYDSGSGSTTLTFEYTVGAGNTSADLDYAATTSLALNGGAITDAATNAATLTLAAPGAPGSLGGRQGAGHRRHAAGRDGRVLAPGQRQLPGRPGRPGDGDVQRGRDRDRHPAADPGHRQPRDHGRGLHLGLRHHHADLRVHGRRRQHLGRPGLRGHDRRWRSTAARITDAAGNAATLTLPAPGASGSLGGAKALVIDTTPPVVTVTRVNGALQTFPFSTGATVTSIGGTCGTATGDVGHGHAADQRCRHRPRPPRPACRAHGP